VELEDELGQVVYLSIFGRALTQHVKGDRLLVIGGVERFNSGLYLSLERQPPARALGSVWAQYTGLHSLVAGDKLEALVTGAFCDESSIRECASVLMGETGLTEAALMQACAQRGHDFASIAELLQTMHRPATVESGFRALDCARAISAMAIEAAALRHHVRQPHPKAPLPVNPADIDVLARQLPMPLTGGQLEVARSVLSRLQSPVPLSGLLSGDVGTGKTLAFLLPAIAAHRAGARVSIVAPRTLLADQIYEQIRLRFGSMVRCVERIPAGGTIKDHDAILVGTSGLATVAARSKYSPQFLVCDEQHKFSTDAREALVGPATHLLEVSATPVPRSLAAALYRGMEILNLRECPVSKTIHSRVIDMASRAQVIAGIRQALATGGRAAVIYPVVSAEEDDESQSVTKAFESLGAAFPGQAIMLHGGMTEEEMRANIEQLRCGERRLVIASTVLEIGIDIPSISFMAVRDADRFGISQLHQLRGRLVRNGGTGHFAMIVNDLAQTPQSALDRLNAVAATTDGYELAEMDLQQRGFGELEGSAQSGETKTVFRRIKLGAKDFSGGPDKEEPNAATVRSQRPIHER
jgi:ATP-dependent DNA helicase RecG